jgi:HNH endonuclease/NUMOD4 motif
MSEIWKDVPGYEGTYKVSNEGRIWSVYRGKYRSSDGKILSPYLTPEGYFEVVLCLNGEQTKRKVHVLVAAAFIGPRPSKLTVNHKNGIKTNNAPENLEYITLRENLQHAHFVLKRHLIRENHRMAVLTEEQVKYILNTYVPYKRGHSCYSLGKKFGVHPRTVHAIVTGENWKQSAN